MQPRISPVTLAFTSSLLLVSTLSATSEVAAETYPSKPIRMIVPTAPGGANDILARTIGPRLTQSLGQPIIVDNRGGAGGTIAANTVAKARPDGYTLVLGSLSHLVLAPSVHPDKPYDAQRDFTPIVQLVNQPIVLAVHPSFRVATVTQLIAAAKAAPGKVVVGSPNVGSSMHLAVELLERRAGIEVTHVSYKGGGPAVIELAGGHIPALFVGLAPALPHIRSGRFNAIAVAGARRATVLPEVSTVGETLPGYEVNFWAGVLAPSKTPLGVVAKLNSEIVRIINDRDVSKQLQEASFDLIAGTPAQFSKAIVDDTNRWVPVLRTAGIKLE